MAIATTFKETCLIGLLDHLYFLIVSNFPEQTKQLGYGFKPTRVIMLTISEVGIQSAIIPGLSLYNCLVVIPHQRYKEELEQKVGVDPGKLRVADEEQAELERLEHQLRQLQHDLKTHHFTRTEVRAVSCAAIQANFVGEEL